jgi:superfamily II DNA or RNA helicase
MNNQEKGLQYEIFVKKFIIHNLGKNAYLWNECPENILIENNLVDSHNALRLLRKDVKEGYLHTHKDIGIDIIQLDNDCCSIIQCKNGYENGLCIHDLAGIMMRSAFLRDKTTFIYYTNCLSRNIRYLANMSPYVITIDCNSKVDKLQQVSYDNKIYFVKLSYDNTDVSNSMSQLQPSIAYSYQTEAINKFKDHFLVNNRGILSLPCGCGKTYTAFVISNAYKQIVILSPLREFASQNLNRFIEYGYIQENTLLVDTDGIRDIQIIKNFIQHNDKLLISCTYDSMDLISECLDMFTDALFIIDEFHNLSKNDISDDTNNIFKLLMSDHKILFMSATPRIYDIEYDNEDFDMMWLFGDIIYNITMTEAIENKYICDYRLWLPAIHENNEDLDKELSIYEIETNMMNRCKFLYSCLCNNGSRKCIVYCRDTGDMKNMMACMQTLNEFYIMDIVISSISCEDSEKKRKECLKQFAASDKIHVLFNIKILNECIDIPVCDSVYISYPPKNKITTIQRICRANRLDKQNPYKIANIYIWCDDYEEILETLSSIKEYDVMFQDKIKVNTVDFYHSQEDNDLQLIKKDKELVSNYTLGIKEFRLISWDDKFEMLKTYIKEYKKTPSSADKNHSIRQLGIWFIRQKQIYNKQMHIFRNSNIRNIWNEFMTENQDLFKSNDDIWMLTFHQVKDYVSQHHKLPSSENKDVAVKKLGIWVLSQKSNFKSQTNRMKNDSIKTIWHEFVQQHTKLFRDNETKWFDYLNELDEYIQKHHKLPLENDTDKNVGILGNWLSDQKYRYKKQTCIMKNEEIRNIWFRFTQKHAQYFMSNEEVWKQKLAQVEEFASQNDGKLPYLTDKDPNNKILAKWLYHQAENYKDNKQSLSDPQLRGIWEEFVCKYPCRKFLTSEQYWLQNLNKVVVYIQTYNEMPKTTKDKQLSSWVSRQRKLYANNEEIMCIPEIRVHWENFKMQWNHIS